LCCVVFGCDVFGCDVLSFFVTISLLEDSHADICAGKTMWSLVANDVVVVVLLYRWCTCTTIAKRVPKFELKSSIIIYLFSMIVILIVILIVKMDRWNLRACWIFCPNCNFLCDKAFGCDCLPNDIWKCLHDVDQKSFHSTLLHSHKRFCLLDYCILYVCGCRACGTHTHTVAIAVTAPQLRFLRRPCWWFVGRRRRRLCSLRTADWWSLRRQCRLVESLSKAQK